MPRAFLDKLGLSELLCERWQLTLVNCMGDKQAYWVYTEKLLSNTLFSSIISLKLIKIFYIEKNCICIPHFLSNIRVVDTKNIVYTHLIVISYYFGIKTGYCRAKNLHISAFRFWEYFTRELHNRPPSQNEDIYNPNL